MPFMGKDWRSPGEAWVKTESLGWQRMKIIESQLYLSACHQNNPACSWPPRNQFGQHMANNCEKSAQQDSDDYDKGFARRVMNESRSSCNLVGSSSGASSSADSSRQSSASASPIGTPEKNSSSRHIHPIAISSPYGCFSASTCCVHLSHASNHQHLHQNNNNNNNIRSLPCGCADPRTHQMSRSLSRETHVGLRSSTPLEKRREPLLSYNSSSPEFRNISSTPGSDRAPDLDDGRTTQYCVEIGGPIDGPSISQESNSANNSQVLMENGVKVCEENSPVGPSINPKSDRSASQSSTIGPSLCYEGDQSCQLPCGCCCCSSQSSPVNPSELHLHHVAQEPQPKTAPHCRISVRTREVAMHNTISEAFYRLDFYNAIHDIRRFNYICKLLHLLITQNLTSLSGCATRVLFTMLEQVAWEVSSNKRNIHVIRNLLEELRLTIQKYYCWGRPIGSSLLWQQHFETIERISQIVNGIELSPPEDGNCKVTFNHLPVEMIREILLRLSDYRDLVSSARASPVMQSMIDDQCIWQKLCRYHFTDQQLKLALENKENFAGRRTLRGIKYARATTADGRSSYRKPITHKQPSSSSSSKTTSRQLADGNASRRYSSRRNSDGSKSSQVTDVVKIFNKAHSMSSHNGGHPSSRSTNDQEPGCTTRGKEDGQPRPAHGANSTDFSTNKTGRSKPGIDWEHMFHQLRKRFDLKEEYPDCLLLCRHCRCLFWKSFGHPCIKSDDFEQGATASTPMTTNQSSRSGDQNNQTHHSNVSGVNSPDRRLSVASLSRNFGRQAPQGSGANGSRPVGSADEPRRPLDNLSAQLRERNANRLFEQQNRRLPDGQENVANNQRQGALLGREELVPKHVTISPQAFLKFFSL